jgi:protoporphyrinogen oxidase
MGVLRADDRIPVRQVIELTPAYVIYDLDHAGNVALVLSWLADHDIWSAGRFGEWEYLNMDHAIASGMRAARGEPEVAPALRVS